MLMVGARRNNQIRTTIKHGILSVLWKNHKNGKKTMRPYHIINP
jgi:hypothetical protein